VFIRRQQLPPKFSVSSFEGGHVHRKARRTAEAFKGAIEYVVHGECSNVRHIQIMELVFYKCMLSDTVKLSKYPRDGAKCLTLCRKNGMSDSKTK